MTRRSIILASGSISSSVEEPQDANTEVPQSPPSMLLLPTSKLDHQHQQDEEEGDNDSVSSISQEDEDEDEHDEPATSVSSSVMSKPRSIFGRYWEAEGDCPPKQLSPPQRTSSPLGVMDAPYYQAPYSPTLDMLMVDKAIQILEGDDNHDDPADDDMNTYERTLRDCEVLPSWRKQLPLAWFQKVHQHQSAPSLTGVNKHNLMGGLTRTRQMQSDSALLTTPLKSVLRQGRFSATTTPQRRATSTTPKVTTPSSSSQVVHFQPKIQVCSYQPPKEIWAAEGWSQWFGS